MRAASKLLDCTDMGTFATRQHQDAILALSTDVQVYKDPGARRY